MPEASAAIALSGVDTFLELEIFLGCRRDLGDLGLLAIQISRLLNRIFDSIVCYHGLYSTICPTIDAI